MKSLAKNSIYNAVYQVLNIVFPLISSIYVSRIIFADGVGRVTYAQNVVSYFTTVAALGIPTVGVRVIAIARDNRQRLDKAFSEMIVLNTLSTSLAVAAYVVVLFVNPELRSDIFLYAATGIVLVFHYISIDWLFQGLEEYSYIVIRNIVVKILSLMALFLFVKNREDYLKYALILSLATCSNYLFNAIHSRKYVSLVFKHLDLKQHIKPILLISGSLFLASIYGKLDITMLGTMIGTESVGYYSYAHRIIQIGISFCTAVTAAFFPRLSYYFQHDSEKFRSLILRGIQITAFLSFPVATGMFILAPEIVELLYGPMFLPAIGVLRIFQC